MLHLPAQVALEKIKIAHFVEAIAEAEDSDVSDEKQFD